MKILTERIKLPIFSLEGTKCNLTLNTDTFTQVLLTEIISILLNCLCLFKDTIASEGLNCIYENNS